MRMLSTFSLISYPVGVRNLNAKRKKHLFRSPLTKNPRSSERGFFIQAVGLVWNQCALRTVWHHGSTAYGISRQAVFLVPLRIDAMQHSVLIPYGTACQFHTATSCGFHPRLRRDFWGVLFRYTCPDHIKAFGGLSLFFSCPAAFYAAKGS